MDLHNYKKKLKSSLERLEKSELLEINKKLIFDFHNFCFSEGIGEAKIVRYVFDLKKIGLIVNKSFDECTKEDVQMAIAEIEKSDYAYNTKRGFRIVLKKFYKWLKKTEDVYPQEVRWIKTTSKKPKEKLPDQLPNQEEVLRMIQKTDKPRDRALIACLYESAARIGELAELKVKDITFGQQSARLKLTGKTGQRVIPIVTSMPYLLEWINKHPDNKNPEEYVWIKPSGEPMSYARIKTILFEAAQKAQVTKKVNPHNFRHARLTELSNDLSDAQLKVYAGWTRGSRMAEVYVHLGQRDIEGKIFEINGIKNPEESKGALSKPIVCSRCSRINEPSSKFCSQCSMILDSQEAQRIVKVEQDKERINKFMNELSEDPEFKALIKKKLNL